MAKLAPTSIKYLVKARIKAKGVIEKHDVIGAIFGQTEGLLGSDLDLRELQETGRIGRIEVNLNSHGGNSEGEVLIPSSLDATETALIAATLETIERVGPCTAEIRLDGVQDTRSVKRQYVLDRAKEILRNLVDTTVPSSQELTEKIKESVRTDEISSYQGLPAGPGLHESEEIIIVEGRADILNLLKYGIRNTIAIEGTSVPPLIEKLCTEKTVTALVDGDRGGELIVKELMQKADIDFVGQAPPGREIEELAKKELFKAIRDRVSPQEFLSQHKGDNGDYRRYERGRDGRDRGRGRDRGFRDSGRPAHEQPAQAEPAPGYRPGAGSRGSGFEFPERTGPADLPEPPMTERPRQQLRAEDRELFKKTLDDLVGTRAACIFDMNNELLGKVPVAELPNTLKTLDSPRALVFDGRVDFKLNMIARRKGVEFLVGMEREDFNTPITVLTKKELE